MVGGGFLLLLLLVVMISEGERAQEKAVTWRP